MSGIFPDDGYDNPRRWTFAQVAAYLRKFNLAEEYVRVFESEGVNGMVLMTLTKEELEGAPFHMKGFVPVRTVLGCISNLKEQEAAGRRAKRVRDEQAYQLPDVPTPPQNMPSSATIDEVPTTPVPLELLYSPLAGTVFPLMPPPPCFPTGFTAETATQGPPQGQPMLYFADPSGLDLAQCQDYLNFAS